MIQLIKFDGDWSVDYLSLPDELQNTFTHIKDTLFDDVFWN